MAYARSRGWRTVLGQIDPGPAEERIVADLHRRSALKADWQPAPSQYWDEWRAECDLADTIVVNSAWSRDCLLGEGVAASKLAVVPLALEAPAAARTFSRAYPQRFDAERPMRVLFLGQINLRKGVEALFDAIRLVGDAPIEFWFVGPLQVEVPPDLRNSSRIRWFGPAARSGTDEFYRDADVFVLPSFSDGFGLTQLEARAWHLPVLASRFCGDVVEDGRNGVLLPEVSGAAIADGSRSLGQDSRHTRGVGRVCERTARRTAFDASQAYVATHRTSRTGASAGAHGMTSAPTRTMTRNAPGIDRAYVRQVVRARSYRTASTAIIVAGAAAAFALVSTLDDVNTIFSAGGLRVWRRPGRCPGNRSARRVRNLIRTDLLMLLALYALTFLEFLFPQASFGDEVTVGGAVTGTAAVLVGFAGLAIGRHFVRAHAAERRGLDRRCSSARGR